MCDIALICPESRLQTRHNQESAHTHFLVKGRVWAGDYLRMVFAGSKIAESHDMVGLVWSANLTLITWISVLEHTYYFL